MLALAVLAASAYTPAPLLSRSAIASRPAQQINMQVNKKVLSFDQDGVFEGREVGFEKPQVRLLERVEELRLLSTVADAGLLSAAEDAQLFSKLEQAGAFSTAEKLLPLADDLKLLSTAEYLLNVPSSNLFGLAVLLLLGETALITAVPDDSAVLVALQAVTGLAAGAAAVVLIASSALFSLLQGEV